MNPVLASALAKVAPFNYTIGNLPFISGVFWPEVREKSAMTGQEAIALQNFINDVKMRTNIGNITAG